MPDYLFSHCMYIEEHNGKNSSTYISVGLQMSKCAQISLIFLKLLIVDW